MSARVAAGARAVAVPAWVRSLWPVALLATAWLATLAVSPWDDESITDLGLYREFAADFLGGTLPYRDVAFEYPPLAAPVIAAPGLAGTGLDEYRVAFGVLALALAVGLLFAVRRLAAATGGSPALAAAGVALSPLLAGATIRNHFDLAAVVLAALGLLLVVRDRPALGFAALGAGAMTKAFPLAIAPVGLAWLLARGDRRAVGRAAAGLAIGLAIPALAALALSPSGAADAVTYHLERPVQVESVPALALVAADGFGLAEVPTVNSYGSQGLEHPAGDPLALAWLLLGAATVSLLAVRAAARPGPRELVLAGLAATAAFAVFGKVLSPQFAVWVVPLFALALAWRLWALAAVSGGAIALTFAEFPARYWDLVAREPLPLVLVALRNALLLCAVWQVWRELGVRRHRRSRCRATMA